MADLEQRLTEALTQGAEEAPGAAGLAARARSRARARRRTHLVGAAAAVAFVVGVPAGVVAFGSADHGSAPGPAHRASGGTDNRGVPDGLRVESWHGVTALVPDSWGYGSLADWCAGGSSTLVPRVERPGGTHLDILCPTRTYGLVFQQVDNTGDFDWPVVQQLASGDPDPAYEGARGVGGVLVHVIAPSRDEAQAILATVRAIGPEGDPNGCGPTSTADVRPLGDAMSVCRYDADGGLEQSELLDAGDAARAEDAVRSAPADGRRGPYCPTPHAPTTVIRMVSRSLDATVSFGGSCWSDTRVTFEGFGGMLGRKVLYWALSPGWSGSVPDGVSLPSELRTPD
jgi:hypothetical protein